MLGRRIAAVVVVLVVGVAGWAAPTVDWPSGVVPWVDAPVPVPSSERSALQFPPPASGPPCRAADLLGTMSSQGGPPGGSRYGTIRLRNTGRAPCRIDGDVALAGITQSGEVQPITLVRDEVPGDVPLVDLSPTRQARMVVRSYTRGMGDGPTSGEVWCDPTGTARHDGIRYVHVPSYAAMRLTLPSGELLDVAGGLDFIQCHRYGTMLGPGGFSVDDAWTPAVGPVVHLVPTIQAPKRAWQGEQVTYTVTLTNRTNEPIRLDPCPSYTARLSHGGAPRQYRLNCAGAEFVPGRSSVRFAMRHPVPLGAAEGNSISWRLDVPGGPEAHQALHVLPPR